MLGKHPLEWIHPLWKLCGRFSNSATMWRFKNMGWSMGSGTYLLEKYICTYLMYLRT